MSNPYRNKKINDGDSGIGSSTASFRGNQVGGESNDVQIGPRYYISTPHGMMAYPPAHSDATSFSPALSNARLSQPIMEENTFAQYEREYTHENRASALVPYSPPKKPSSHSRDRRQSLAKYDRSIEDLRKLHRQDKESFISRNQSKLCNKTIKSSRKRLLEVEEYIQDIDAKFGSPAYMENGPQFRVHLLKADIQYLLANAWFVRGMDETEDEHREKSLSHSFDYMVKARNQFEVLIQVQDEAARKEVQEKRYNLYADLELLLKKLLACTQTMGAQVGKERFGKGMLRDVYS